MEIEKCQEISIEKAQTGKVEYVSKGILSKVRKTNDEIV